MITHTCDHCGCVLNQDTVFHFHGGTYCSTCMDELTTICDHCGERIFGMRMKATNTSPSVADVSGTTILPVIAAVD